MENESARESAQRLVKTLEALAKDGLDEVERGAAMFKACLEAIEEVHPLSDVVLYDVDEAAEILRVSVGTVRQRTRAGKPTWDHTRVGGHVRFTPEHLTTIVENGAVRAITPRRSSRRSFE